MIPPTVFGPQADADIDAQADLWDSFLPGFGSALRLAWAECATFAEWLIAQAARHCDCDLTDGHHRWNCFLTPIWSQTMRDLDINPWTILQIPETS